MNDEHQDSDQKAPDGQALYSQYSRSGLWKRRMRAHARGFAWTATVMIASGSKRVLDMLLSLILLAIFSPLLVLGFVLSGFTLERRPRLGKWCRVFDELSFASDRTSAARALDWIKIRRLPVLINICKGDMSFVGPLPASPGELSASERTFRRRYDVRPGLISPWWIRQRANIDYESQWQSDASYVSHHSVWGDIGISLRAVPAVLYGTGGRTAPDMLGILGIPINNCTMNEALDTIGEWSQEEGHHQVCFVNADCANIAYMDRAYLQVLRGADLCLADGIGLKLAGKILGQEVKQNVNGTDLFPKLCEVLSGKPIGLFLLGARDGVAQGVADWVRTHFPQVRVCGCQHGYFSTEEEAAVVQRIRDSGAHILLVAFGAPKQDMWIEKHLKDTGARVAMGVGGLFDFYSGRISRAPEWVREIGMEWVYRLIQEPGRLWKRYIIGNGLFLLRVLNDRVRGHRERSGH